MTFGHLLALKYIQICISQSFVSFFLIYLKTLNEIILLNLQVKSASEFGCLCPSHKRKVMFSADFISQWLQSVGIS